MIISRFEDSYFCLNITANDSASGVDTVYAEVWNTTSWVNYTMFEDTTSCDGTASDGIYGVEIQGTPQGIWNYSKTYANDTLNNWNSYDFPDLTINVTAPADSYYPQFSGFAEDPANNSEYLFGQNYQFNSTVTTTNGTVYLSFDNTNYSATNDTVTNFYVDFASLSKGTYNYYWFGYGNGTLKHYNQSSVRVYVVQKETGSCAVNFNESSGIIYPGTFLVWNNCTSGAVLYRNGTQIINNSVQSLSAGTWNFTVTRNDTANYTNIYDEQEFLVNKFTASLSLNAIPSWTETYPTQTNITGSQCPTQITCNLYREGIEINSENSQNVTLGFGVYNYTYNTTGNENYTAYTNTTNLTISQNTGACQVLFNESSGINYPATFRVWSDCNSDFTL